MLPKAKTSKTSAPAGKKRGRAPKRKFLPPSRPASIEEVPGEVEVQSMLDLMKTMSETLCSLNNRVGMIEGAAASHTMYTAPPVSCATRVTGQDHSNCADGRRDDRPAP